MQGNTVIRPKDMGIKRQMVDKMKIKPISWADFRGNVPDNQWYHAHIYWHIEYSYGYTTPQVKIPKVTTRPTISARSWKKEHAIHNIDLLRHEYGHYLIGCLCALDFQTQVNSVDAKKFANVDEFRSWSDKLFKNLMRQYCKLEKLYDKETEHYCDEDQQAKWQAKIAQMINQYIPNEEPLTKTNSQTKSRQINSVKKPNARKNSFSNYRIRDSCKKPAINQKTAIKI